MSQQSIRSAQPTQIAQSAQPEQPIQQIVSEQSGQPEQPEQPVQSTKNHVAIVVVLAFAALLATYNETLMNVALAPIMVQFSIQLTTVQWLACAYMLTVAVMIPLAPFVYQSIPTKKLYPGILGLLLVGTVVGGCATNFPQLLIARIIQACGSGLLIPTSINLTVLVAPRQKLGFYMGLMAAMTTIGVTCSVIASGVLMSLFTWHALFWSYAILLVVCFCASLRYIGNIVSLTHPSLDPLSVVLISLGLIGVLYGISISFTGSLTLAASSFVVGCVLLAIFLHRQTKIKNPLLNVAVFKIGTFRAGIVLIVIALISVFSLNIIFPTFMQSALEKTSLYSALTLFPGTILGCVTAAIAGRVYDRYGIKFLLPEGCVLIAVFAVILSACMGTEINLIRILAFIPVSMGAMMIIGPMQSYALSRLAPEQNAHGITVMTTGFQIAGCLGSSVFSGIYTVGANRALVAGLTQTAAFERGFLIDGIVIAILAAIGFGLAIYLVRDEMYIKA